MLAFLPSTIQLVGVLTIADLIILIKADCVYGVNTIKPTTKQAAVTLGVGVSGHELTHALDKSGLNTITAATS
jgi:hypothetical protein